MMPLPKLVDKGEVKKLDRAARIAKRKTEKYKKSCGLFIKERVNIEDRDAEDIVQPFNLWPEQDEVLQTFQEARKTIVLKARQLGLTWLALAYAIWCMIFKAGYSVVCISEKEDPNAKELIRRTAFILRYMPSWLIVEDKNAGPGYNGLTWSSKTLSVTITHPEGEPSIMTAMSSSANAGRSFTANLVILDEWAFQQFAEEIWSAAYPTINRPTGGKIIGISTAKRNTLFEALWEGAERGDNTFKTIFLPWSTDPRRDQAFINDARKTMPTKCSQEYPSTPEEAFSGGDDIAFQEFTREIHVIPPFPIPSYWKRWRGNDPGFGDPFGWYWFCVDDDGNVYIYREFARKPDSPRLSYSEQAKEVTARSFCLSETTGQMEPEKFLFTATGHDAFNPHAETGKAIVDYYKDGGVTGCINPIINLNLSRVSRAAAWHEALQVYDGLDGKKTARLKIFNTCPILVDTIPKLLVDDNDRDKVAGCAVDHYYDAAGYGLMHWHTKCSTKPLPEKSEIQKHKEAVEKQRDKNRMKNGMLG